MKKLLLLAAGAAMLVYSCGKRYDDPNVVSTFNTYPSLDSVFSELSLKPKYVSLDAATGGSFYGNSGTKYTFPANAFQTGSGASVTGNVQIAVTEYLKRGDMIFSQMLPISNGQPLESAGQVEIKATQGGAELFIKPGMTYTIDIPQGGTPVQGMNVFMGDPTEPTTTGSRVNWRQARVDSSTIPGSTVYLKDTIRLVLDSLNLINGDKYRNQDSGQIFTLNVSANGTKLLPGEFVGYVLVGSQNSVFYLSGNWKPKETLTCNLPKTLFHLVTMVLKDKKFYGGVLSVTPENGKSYNINMVEVDPKALKAQINSLLQ